jgi:hypothetical protein
MALNVDALNDFSNEVAGRVVPKMVFEGYTTSILPVQEGIKYQEPLNIFDTTVTIQSDSCAAEAKGAFSASQETITVVDRISYDSICLDQMNPKYLGVSALELGSYNETFKLAEVYTSQIVNQMKRLDDNYLWESGSGTFADATTEAAGATLIASATGSQYTTATALDILDDYIAAIPSDISDRDDLTIWMGVSQFRQYIAALRKSNNYYNTANDTDRAAAGTLVSQYPFANVKVVGTPGITDGRICLMPDAYAVVGTDLLSDIDNFQLWYDINSDSLKHRLKHKLGAAVAFKEWVLTNIAV